MWQKESSYYYFLVVAFSKNSNPLTDFINVIYFFIFFCAHEQLSITSTVQWLMLMDQPHFLNEHSVETPEIQIQQTQFILSCVGT